MPGRSFNSGSYRFGGAGGQEMDNEISGVGNSYTAEYWQYDSRLMRRWNVDPLAHEFPWQSTYSAFNNNPIYFIDPDGRVAIASNGDNDDEWRVNIDTGEETWVSGLGGDEVQFINYTNNSGEFLGMHQVEGSEAFVGKARDGWVASKFNLWDGINSDYNSNSGYDYSYSDLKLRYWLLNSPQSYNGFATAIRNSEAAGMADPITADNYWNKYGHTLGNMILMEFYITTADGLLSAEGVNGMKFGRRGSFGNFNRTSTQPASTQPASTQAKQQASSNKSSKIPSLSIKPKLQVPTSFSLYLKSQKGVDIGKYKGRGEWMKQQAIKYNEFKD